MGNEQDAERKAQVYQDAIKRTDELMRADPSRNVADPTLPIYQVAALDRLEQERQRFEAGDRMALLGALRICANYDLVMPAWLSRAYIKAYDSVLFARVGSWDRAFGRPFDGQYMKRRRILRDATTTSLVAKWVSEGMDVGQAIAKAATAHHVSPKTVETAYYKGARKVRPKA